MGICGNALDKAFYRVVLVVLIVGAGLAACGGGGGGDSVPVPPALVVSPPAVYVPPSGTITGYEPHPVNTSTQLVVISRNSLAVGSLITITGSTWYDGTYSVLARDNFTFTIAASFVANTAAGTWVGVGGPIAGCSSTGATGVITLPNMGAVASRFSGVAPLAVFFNATGTVAPAVASRPFHELEYRWNFRDDDTVTWGFGAHAFGSDTSNLKKKNRATGPVAAHVFETPGTYIVRLDVTDGTNTVTNECMQISVLDPDVVFSGLNTICISATAPTPVAGVNGCPVGSATAVQSNWTTIVSTLLGTNKRILLKRGDTFTGGASTSMAVVGPATIGAYGAGPKPVIRTSGTGSNSSLMSFVGTTSDLRLVDLDLDGQSNGARVAMLANGGTISNLTKLRLDVHDIGCGIEFPLSQMATAVNGVVLQDSTIRNILSPGGAVCPVGLRYSALSAAVLGNDFNDSTAANSEHLIRMELMQGAIIAHNTVANVKTGKEMLSLRAPCSAASPCGSAFFGSKGFSGDGAATKYVVISDNLIKTNTYAGIHLTQITPTDSALIRDIIIERNYLQGTTGGGTGVRVIGNNVTVRNNIIDHTNGTPANHSGVQTDSATAGMAAATNVSIYNNSIYSGDVGDFFGGLLLPGGTSIVFKNNIGYAPNGTTTFVMLRDQATGTTIANNTCNTSDCSTGIKTSPTFANGSGLLNTPSDFKLSGGYALNAGGAVPVFSDFFGLDRPGVGIDMGATEQ